MPGLFEIRLVIYLHGGFQIGRRTAHFLGLEKRFGLNLRDPLL